MRKMILTAALAALTLPAIPASAQTVGVFTQGARRAWLGFSYESVARSGRDAPAGVVVRTVVDDSPAERAGIEVGDTITRINDINATDQFIASLGSALSPGDEVSVQVRRDGRTRTMTITAAQPPAEYRAFGATSGLLRFDNDSIRSLVRIFVDSAAASIDSLRVPNIYIRRDGDIRWLGGDSLRSYNFSYRLPDSLFAGRLRADSMLFRFDSLRTAFSYSPAWGFMTDSVSGVRIFTSGDSAFGAWRMDGTPFGFTMLGRTAIAGAELTRLDPAMESYFGVRDGVLVLRVPRGTPAARAGLESGDVIIRVNGNAVMTVEELRREIQRTEGDRPARLEVIRRNQRRTIELQRE